MAVVTGEVQLTFTSIAPTMALIKSGKMIPLAVTGARRSSALPDVPTVAESGVSGYEEGGFYGLVMAGRTPAPTLAKLNKETAQIVESAEIHKAYNAVGIDPVSSTPEEFTKFLVAQYTKWAEVFKNSPIPSDN